MAEGIGPGYPGRGSISGLSYAALGIAGEAGEFADKVKKILRDSNGQISSEARVAMLKELGDVMWYLTAAAQELQSDLRHVAQINLDKVTERDSRGTVRGSGDDR